MARPISYSQCHPERRNYGHGKCRECYIHDYVRTDARKKHNREKAQLNGNGRRWVLKHRYNITPEQYDAMFQHQHGLCAICGSPSRGKTPLCIDHNHTTNVVRGLLCTPCNRTFGYFENSTWRQQAETYLAKYPQEMRTP